MEIILTASPSENPILPVLKHKKIMNGASRWITASLMLWSHPLRSLNLIPSIMKLLISTIQQLVNILLQ